jgi:2-dehydro-3-deoxygluconokinase
MSEGRRSWALPAGGAKRWDLAALGEVMLRLDPGEGRIRNARSFNVWEGGGEYNVARGLSRTFRRRTAVLTALPRSPLGSLAESLIAQARVDVSAVVWRDYDGVGREARMGLNFTERGFGVRPPQGVSDRAYSAASALGPQAFDWDDVLGATGAHWLHTGGVFAALSAETAETTLAAVRAARRLGVTVSYDINYRESLWRSHPDPEVLRAINRAIMAECDLVFADDRGLAACVGLDSVEVGRRAWPTDPGPSSKAAARAFDAFPSLRGVAYTLRDPKSASVNGWQGVFHERGERHASIARPDLEILDRVGGGDAFAAGLIHGLMAGETALQAVELAAAHGALAMTTPGDNAEADLAEVEALIRGDCGGSR